MFSVRDISFNTLIVFGQGPIKPVLLPFELTPLQSQKWNDYINGISGRKEPHFYVLDESSYLDKLTEIKNSNSLSEEEKKSLTEAKRIEWQKTGQFAMRKWGRENALAAGLALYSGMTEEVILTGGRTKSVWAKQSLSSSRLSCWPSEAELMSDVIIKNFGKLYFEKYGKRIQDALKLENEATNTLENFSYTLNAYPYLLKRDKKIGLLTVRHHLNRVEYLANLFSLQGAWGGQLCAEEVLKMFTNDLKKRGHDKILRFLDSEDDDAQVIVEGEGRWVKAMDDPNYVSYWCGYVADVKYPSVVQNIIHKLDDPLWFAALDQVLSQFGLRACEYQNVDLAYLYEHEPEKYYLFVSSLQKCKSPNYRKMPPENFV